MMIHTPFALDPVKAFLVMERENLLSEPVDETSPLRRPHATQHARQMAATQIKEEGEEGNESTAEMQKDLGHPLPIVWDSRLLPSSLDKSTPKYIFVARKGQRFDGHSLIETVLASGNLFIGELRHAESYLQALERPEEWIDEVTSHPYFIKVTSSEHCLRLLLEKASGLSPDNFTSVGITGTNGKTSVTQILGQLLEHILARPVLRLGTLGVQMGTLHSEGTHPTMPDLPGFLQALTTARKTQGIDHLVFEATSHGLHEGRMGLWKIDVAVFTNFTQDHLDYHKTMDHYRTAKGVLFEGHLKHAGTAVINTDDPEWGFFLSKAATNTVHCIGYGSVRNKAEFFTLAAKRFLSVRFLNISQRLNHVSGTQGVWSLESEKGALAQAHFSTDLVGDFQHDNLAASAAALVALGYPLQQIAQSTHAVKSIPGRLELVRLGDPQVHRAAEKKLPTVLVDYAHSPDALHKALLTCRAMRPATGKLVCVFGCGGDRDPSKRPLMGQAAAELADLCIVTSDNPRSEEPLKIIEQIVAGVEHHDKVKIESDRKKAIRLAISACGEKDLVLIAGKGHEDYQIIGTEKIHFSDVEEARKALKLKLANT